MLPNVVGESRTVKYLLMNTVVLVISSLLPVWFGFLGYMYGASAVILGAYFISRNIEFLRDISKENARKNFHASMVYLGGLYLAVIIDVCVF